MYRILIIEDDDTIAKNIAAQAEASNVEGNVEDVQHVIECIQVPGATFSDKKFWKFFQEFPR